MTKNRRTTIIRLLLLISTIVSLFFVPWILVKAWILPLPHTVHEQVDEAISHGFDGIIVYVDEAGKPPAFYTAGWKDRDNRIASEPDSLFKIASISKLYAAVAITKMAREQRLSLDDLLVDHLPELKDRIEHSEKITLKMMVQHKSGIPNFTDNAAYWENEPENSKRALDFALDLPASFEPGDGYEYSNTNYLLLRKIMDKVLGYSHHEYIKQKILLPLELNNTYFSLSEVNMDDVMSGYYVGYEEDVKARDYGMLATAEDVGKFLRALNNGAIFNEGEAELDPYVFEHGGLVIGYQSLAEYDKDLDTVVVQFINTTDFDGYEWNLSEITISRLFKILRKAENE